MTSSPTQPTAQEIGADPRPLYRAAQHWACQIITNVSVDQLDGPTPCKDWDVRTLVGHLVATVDRARVIGDGGEPFSVPTVVTGIPDHELSARYERAVEEFWPGWADESRLDAELTAPWGPVSGRGALFGYAREAVVHGWDLARATGQNSEAPEWVASMLLETSVMASPAEPRGGHVPFEAPVEPAATAGTTQRLANWLGHSA
jgi:uncharacterized protein (TIGR03086 family)